MENKEPSRDEVMEYAKKFFRYGPPEQPQYDRQKINSFMVGYDHASKLRENDRKRIEELEEEIGESDIKILTLQERVEQIKLVLKISIAAHRAVIRHGLIENDGYKSALSIVYSSISAIESALSGEATKDPRDLGLDDSCIHDVDMGAR